MKNIGLNDLFPTLGHLFIVLLYATYFRDGINKSRPKAGDRLSSSLLLLLVITVYTIWEQHHHHHLELYYYLGDIGCCWGFLALTPRLPVWHRRNARNNFVLLGRFSLG
jgi:hypothetical protein